MTKKDALTIALSTLTASTYPNPNFNGEDTVRKEIPAEEVREVITKMIAQLSAPHPMSEEKKAARRENAAAERRGLMAKVIPAITAVLPTSAEEGRTAKETFEAAKANLPSDFTANKVQYVLLHDMIDIVGKTEAKGKANTYYRIVK